MDLGGVEHQRIPIDEVNEDKFGLCEEHQSRKNEYYDKKRNRAFCTNCAIDLAQGNEDVHKQLVSIDSAYTISKDSAKNQDADLDIRKSKIETYLDSI